jgi:hypothetical protein
MSKSPLRWLGISLSLGSWGIVLVYNHLHMNNIIPYERMTVFVGILTWTFFIAQPLAILLGIATWRTWQGKLSILLPLLIVSYEFYGFVKWVDLMSDLHPSK